jgi:RNA polymerase sigma-70 factor (ECF subfamily)
MKISNDLVATTPRRETGRPSIRSAPGESPPWGSTFRLRPCDDQGVNGGGNPLATAFLARLGTGAIDIQPEDLELELDATLAGARAAWPEITLSAVDFVAHVAVTLGPKANRAALQALRPRAAELYLARACAAGDARALAILDAKFLAAIAGHLRSFHQLDIAQEALQQLRTRLYMAHGDQPPRILQYTGEGTLLGWLKVAALRLATDLQRSQQRDILAMGEEPGDELACARDPEFDYIKQRYRADFRAAVRAAVQALTQKERSMLRLYALDGLNIDEIGRAFHVHRATAARWIANCRDKVRNETRRQLRERLGASNPEVESVLRLLDSDLEASLHGALEAS